MYTELLTVHSWIRWIALLTAFAAVARAFKGVAGGPWTKADDSAGRWFVLTLDLQFLLGLILYVALSPITRLAFENFGGAMRDPQLRFWAVEHGFGMIAALALAHIGRVKIRKTGDTHAKHRAAAVFFTLALILMLLSIPWPGLTNGRPLLRGASPAQAY